MTRALLAAALLVVAGGCTTLRFLMNPPPRLAPCAGPIPSSATLPAGDRVWHDRARYRGGEVDAGFALVAEKRGGRLVLVGFDGFGARAFSVTQQGDALDVDARLGRALAVPPETLLRDWHALRAAGTAPPATLVLARPECGYEATFAAEQARTLSASPSP